MRSSLPALLAVAGWCAGALAAGPTPAARVELLRFPYPYRGALTVCSDTHAVDPRRFEAVHTLINGTARIEPGSPTWAELFRDPEIESDERWREGIDGFGFPFGDTMWLYSPSIGVFAMFDEEIGAPVPHGYGDGRDYRDLFDTWLRRGWVDALHAGGPTGQSRRAIAAGLRWLTAQPHRRLTVWVDHSLQASPSDIEPDVPVGLPVIAKNLVKTALGLLPRDLANRLGASRDVSDPWPFPPGQRLSCWLLSAALLGSLAWLVACLAVARIRTATSVLVGALGLAASAAALHRLPLHYAQGDNPGSRYYNLDLVREAGFRFFWLVEDGGLFGGLKGRLAAPDASWNGRPSVLRSVTVDDGSRILVFPRTYRGRGGWHSLELLTDENLTSLAERGSAAILYTHWAHAAHEVFSARALQGLERLRRHHAAGRIWLATASRLLQFEFLRTFLRYEVQQREGGIVIAIDRVDDPVGAPFTPTLEDLRGISFAVRGDGPIELRLAGSRIPREQFEVIQTPDSRIVRLTRSRGSDPPMGEP